MQSATIIAWMEESGSAIRSHSDQLTQLDSAIGDGDHGLNMTRGFDAVDKALAGQDHSVPPGRLLVLAGKTLVSSVGGASGPLWGTGLRRGGRSLGDREEFDDEQLSPAWTPVSTESSSWERRREATRRWSTPSSRRSRPCAGRWRPSGHC